MKLIKASILNVALTEHPEGPESYMMFFRALVNHKIWIRIHGNRWAAIRSCSVSADGLSLEGEVITARRFDLEPPYVDNTTFEEVDGPGIQWPDHIAADRQVFRYYFDLTTHRFAFESKNIGEQSLTPKLMLTFFKRLSPELHPSLKEFGDVLPTVIPERERLSQIFALPSLKMLRFRIQLPNAMEDGGDAEADIRARLRRRRASKQDETLTSSHPEGLKLDDELRAELTVAEVNGFVHAKGRNEDGARVDLDTRLSPMEKQLEVSEFELDIGSASLFAPLARELVGESQLRD